MYIGGGTPTTLSAEQLEITKAAKLIENNGILLNDYSSITVGSLTNVDAKIRDKYTNKLVVDKDGEKIYYNILDSAIKCINEYFWRNRIRYNDSFISVTIQLW